MPYSTVKFSQIEDRLDAEYYKSECTKTNDKIFLFKDYFTIQELSEKIIFGTTPAGGSFVNSGIPYIKSQNLSDLLIDKEDLLYCSKSFHENHIESKILPKDILVAAVGSIGLVGLVPADLSVAQTNQNVATIRLRDKRLSEFLAIFLSSRIGQNELKRKSTGNNQPYLNTKNIEEIVVPIPENSMIKSITSIVHEAARKRQLARQKYQEAQGLIEKFLKVDEQKLDFENCFSLPFSKIADRIDGEYYQALSLLKLLMFKQGSVPLGDLATINAGKTPAKQTYAKKGVKILKARDLTNQGIDWQNSERTYIKPETWQKIKKAQVQKDDILVLSAAHQAHYIGKHIDIIFDIPEKFNDKLSAVAELLIIRPKTINPYVLLWYLRTKTAYLLIQRLITGETSHLYPKDLVNLPVPKILFKFKDAEKVEKLTQQSLLLQKESKELLEQAKQAVENLIEK